ncbi:MAG: hypothetical protein SW019_24120, partial [Actinomycetota bacterium]|nr:hypothetical protein [Actinomycetota bacterium]
GLGSLAENDLHHRGEPAGWAGDVYDRLLRRIQCARNGIDLDAVGSDILEGVPSLVAGLDVAAARLVIASLGLDIGARAGAGHHG